MRSDFRFPDEDYSQTENCNHHNLAGDTDGADDMKFKEFFVGNV